MSKHRWARRRDGQICSDCGARQEYEACDPSRLEAQRLFERALESGLDTSTTTHREMFWRGFQQGQKYEDQNEIS